MQVYLGLVAHLSIIVWKSALGTFKLCGSEVVGNALFSTNLCGKMSSTSSGCGLGGVSSSGCEGPSLRARFARCLSDLNVGFSLGPGFDGVPGDDGESNCRLVWRPLVDRVDRRFSKTSPLII